MTCSVDHSKLTGLKFCTECGVALAPPKRICTQGHELVRKNKFCETCGSPEASSATSPLPPAPSNSPLMPPPPAPSISVPTPNFDPLLPPPPAFTPQKNKNVIAMITAASIAVLLVIGVIVNANKVTYTSVEVSMSIYDQDCWNLSWGYYDIPGGEVVLSMDGVDVAWADYPSTGVDSSLACTFSTTFFNVPMNGEIYEFSMSSG